MDSDVQTMVPIAKIVGDSQLFILWPMKTYHFRIKTRAENSSMHASQVGALGGSVEAGSIIVVLEDWREHESECVGIHAARFYQSCWPLLQISVFLLSSGRLAICDCVSCCQEEEHQSLQAYIDYMNGRCRLRAMSHGLGQRAFATNLHETDNAWHHKDSKRSGLTASIPTHYDSPAGDCRFLKFCRVKMCQVSATFKTRGASWGLWIPTQIGIWKILATVLANLLNLLESVESSDFAEFVCLELPRYFLGSNNPGVPS